MRLAPAARVTFIAQFGYMRAKAAPPAKDTAPRVPVMLTISEASTALRVGKWTIYQLIRSRQLATVKIRSRRLVPLAALEALLEKQTVEVIA